MGTYGYTGGVQVVTVRNSGTYVVVAYGAQGGNGPRGIGGNGAEIAGSFALQKGEVLRIYAGGAGGIATQQNPGTGFTSGAGGGGGSFVFADVDANGNVTPGTYRLLLAAGGGGGGGTGTGGAGAASTAIGGTGFRGGQGLTSGSGAGYKSNGIYSRQTAYDGLRNPSYGGNNRSGGYAATRGFSFLGKGGFGGGGSAGSANSGGGGGGGGGYTGGNGDYRSSGSGGGAGTSIDRGTPLFFVGGENTGNGKVLLFQPLCFGTSTPIRTVHGDVAVEHLQVGDLAVTASGATRPIVWIGHRQMQCRGHRDLCPVRVAAHAFGSGLPARDLYLSPGHPVLVGSDADGGGGHLVPIMCLINGTTIEHVRVDEVTYWHVELDAHDILLADGLPAESYIDLGSRAWFAGADGALYDPDLALAGLPGRCRPVALDGPVVEAERRRLDMVFATRQSAACAWPSAEDALGI